MALLIGTAANQVPTNGDLGSMAFQQSDAVNITSGTVDATLLQTEDISDARPVVSLDFTSGVMDPRLVFYRYSFGYYYDGKSSIPAEQNYIQHSENSAYGDPANPSLNWAGMNWNGLTGQSHNSGTTDPNGTYRATKLMETSATTWHGIYWSPDSQGGQQTKAWCASVYVKSANTGIGRWGRLGLIYTSTEFAYITWDLSNGSITSGPANSYSTTSAQQIGGTVTGVGNGWYRVSIISQTMVNQVWLSINNASTVRADNYGMLDYAGNTGAGMYVWGWQLEQRDYLTTYVPTLYAPVVKYQPVLVRANYHEPRFECNPATGEILGLLIEPGRTNNVRYSEDFTNAAWAKTNLSVTAAAYWAPTGTYTALKVYDTGGSAQRYMVNSNFSARPDSEQWIISIFVKEFTGGSKRYLTIGGFHNNGAAQYGFYVFDVANMKMTQVRNVNNASNQGFFYFDYDEFPSWAERHNIYTITDCGNGWRRISAYVYANSPSGAGTTAAYFIGMTSNPTPESFSDLAYTGDSNSGLYMWGAQFEGSRRGQNGRPTSYIGPTTSANVNTDADQCFMERNETRRANSSGYNTGYEGVRSVGTQIFQPGPTPKTIYAEYVDGNGDGYLVTIGGNRKYATLYTDVANTRSWTSRDMYMDEGYSDQAQYWIKQNSSPTKYRVRKAAVAMADGDCALAHESGRFPGAQLQISRATPGEALTMDNLYIGNANEASQPCCWIRKVQVYFARLPNKELIDKVG
jgi:hypothetical protein